MSSARIEIQKRGMCSSSGIDRTMPAVMTPYMDNYQWVEFCDKIDEAIAPMNKLGKLTMIGGAVTFAVFALVFIIGFVSFPSEVDEDGDSVGGGPNFFVLFVIPVVAFAIVGALACYTGCKAQEVSSEIQAICKETSAAHSRLTFHVRYEYWSSSSDDYSSSASAQYIEVSICQDAIMSTAVAAELLVPEVPVVESTTKNLSFAGRQAELDKVQQHTLSQDEYES